MLSVVVGAVPAVVARCGLSDAVEWQCLMLSSVSFHLLLVTKLQRRFGAKAIHSLHCQFSFSRRLVVPRVCQLYWSDSVTVIWLSHSRID